jgi:uncharacterized protein (DUF305 family)
MTEGTTRMKQILRSLALPATLAATLVLSACGTGHTSDVDGSHPDASTKSGAPASKAKNEADIEFATMMVPHHTQAVAMADVALTQAADPKVKALAKRIKAAQGPEIERMSAWLTGWGEPVPGAVGGHEMPGMAKDTGGMMSAQEMTDLGKATGSAFDRMCLQMMVRHHQGAVDVARTELAKGANPESKKFAQSIVDSQSAEIAEINSILAGIPA